MSAMAAANREVISTWPRLLTRGVVPGICPGCHYGIVRRALAEVVEEMGIDDRTIAVSDIGCNGLILAGLQVDQVGSLHGRSTATASAIKRVRPENLVFNVIGDGGLTAIGMGHFMAAMIRAEKISTIFVNNAGYGMTGGQFAPTTLAGQATTTTPTGRDPQVWGFPVHIAELASTMEGVAYSARVSVHTPAQLNRAKRAIKTALQKQVDNVGYAIVEIVSACPTDWGLTPVAATEFLATSMLAEYPLGEFKNVNQIDYSRRLRPERGKKGGKADD